MNHFFVALAACTVFLSHQTYEHILAMTLSSKEIKQLLHNYNKNVADGVCVEIEEGHRTKWKELQLHSKDGPCPDIEKVGGNHVHIYTKCDAVFENLDGVDFRLTLVFYTKVYDSENSVYIDMRKFSPREICTNYWNLI